MRIQGNSPHYSQSAYLSTGKARRLSPVNINAGLSPKFGCHLYTAVTPLNITPEEAKVSQKFRENTLLNWDNSFKRQGVPHQKRSEQIKNAFGIPLDYWREEILYLEGCTDGWGMTTFKDGKKIKDYRNMKPAYESGEYLQAAKEISESKAPIAIGHLRVAIGRAFAVRPENLHPFHFGPWSFIHTGVADAVDHVQVTPPIDEFMKNEKIEIDREKATDTEFLFYFILAAIKKEFKTTDPSKIPLEKLIPVLSKAILFYKRPYKDQRHSHRVGNFVLTDGKRVIVYRNNNTRLFYTTKELSPGKMEHLVTTEPMLPKDGSADKKNWREIGIETIVTLEPKDLHVEVSQIELPKNFTRDFSVKKETIKPDKSF
ncbi:MAG: class II glutamine amidotransferase [Vampirovibrio sp.]|nr:class II glutamine amidotransferase [Vampirovibrio sp.]